MKKIFIPALALGVTLASCKGGSPANTESPKQETENYQSNVDATSEPVAQVDQPAASDEQSSDGSKWDQTLDQYEEFIDQYIVLLKKSTRGDQTVTNDYLEMAEKAEALGKQLDQNQDQLNKKQLKRMIDLQGKMSNAIVDLTSDV